MPIDITGTTVSDKISCPKCKREAGFRGQDLLEVAIKGDIKCKFCGEVVISSRPEVRPPYVYAGQSSGHYWDGD